MKLSQGNSARSHGRICWQGGFLRSQWSCHFNTVQPCCWEFLLLRDSQGAQRHTRLGTLLGAGAGISRIRLLVKPTNTAPPKSDAPPHQLFDLAEVPAKPACGLDRPRSAPTLEEEFEAGPGAASSEMECTEVLNGSGSGGGLQRLGGHAQVQRIPRTRHECPGVIITESVGRSDDSSRAGSDTHRNISFTTVITSELCEEPS